MSKIFKNLFIVAMLCCLISCAKAIGEMLPERPDNFNIGEDASAEFKQGWADGCEVGMSAGSNTFYKMFYRNNAVDGYKMSSSPEYKTAWGNAFWYCYRYDHVKQKSGKIWGSTFGGYI